ncbi:MAG: hypothetical protein ACOX2F_10415 [bacterium]
MKKLKLVFVISMIFITFQLFGGVKITTESKDEVSGEKSSGTLLIDGDFVRVDTSESAEQSAIYNLAKKEVIILNHKEKTWLKMTKKQIDDSREFVKKQFKTMMEQQQAALVQLSAEQRAQLEIQMQMLLNDENKTPVKYVKKATKAKWGKGECTIYDGMRGDIKVEEICTVIPKNLKCSLVEIERLREVTLDYAINQNDVSAWKDVKNIGVPVIHKLFQNGKLVVTNTLISFENMKIPIESFKVPADYKETSLPAGN